MMLTQEDFAKRLDTTPKNLSLLIREEQKRRIAEIVRQMINGSEKPISELAFAYDFNSKENFTRAFKKEHSILPTEFKATQNSLRLYEAVQLEVPAFDFVCTINKTWDYIIDVWLPAHGYERTGGYELESNRGEDGQWDLGIKVKDNVYFPLSDSWRKEADRKADCTERIEGILPKIRL